MDQPNIFEEDKERILNRLDYLLDVLRDLESIVKHNTISASSWKYTREVVLDIENMVKELHG